MLAQAALYLHVFMNNLYSSASESSALKNIWPAPCITAKDKSLDSQDFQETKPMMKHT
jgi:hypothetical protein